MFPSHDLPGKTLYGFLDSYSYSNMFASPKVKTVLRASVWVLERVIVPAESILNNVGKSVICPKLSVTIDPILGVPVKLVIVKLVVGPAPGLTTPVTPLWFTILETGIVSITFTAIPSDSLYNISNSEILKLTTYLLN